MRRSMPVVLRSLAAKHIVEIIFNCRIRRDSQGTVGP